MEFDAVELMGAVRKLAKENPNNEYDKEDGFGCCSYIHGTCTNGSKGCIVGQAILIAYPNSLSFLEEYHGNAVRDLPIIDNTSDGRFITWLTTVQNQQDHNVPWAKCVEIADQLLEERS